MPIKKPVNPPVRAPRQVTFTIPNMPRPKAPNMPPLQRIRAWVLVTGFVLAALLGGIGGALLQSKFNQNGLIGSVSNEKKIVTKQSLLISQIAKNVGPSVVSVNVRVSSVDPEDPFSQLFNGGGGRTAVAAGTGIIISQSGLIVTNRHVVPEGTTNVSVTLSDGTQLEKVTVVGRTNANDSLDIAFLKITDTEGKKVRPAVIGDSSKVQVGDDAVAIGNALGQFQNTVTSGIISGFGRSVVAGGSSPQDATENLDNLFQTDAAINEGNSGGPLVNLNGQVIGINTAIAGGGAQNVGFAIPVNDVRGLIEQVLATGKFERTYLGVRYVPLTADIAEQADLRVSTGAYITPAEAGGSPSVLPDSPAAAAGLKEGDIITTVDDVALDQTHSLTSQLAQHKPGDKVSLTIQRGDEKIDIEVTLGAQPKS